MGKIGNSRIVVTASHIHDASTTIRPRKARHQFYRPGKVGISLLEKPKLRVTIATVVVGICEIGAQLNRFRIILERGLIITRMGIDVASVAISPRKIRIIFYSL